MRCNVIVVVIIIIIDDDDDDDDDDDRVKDARNTLGSHAIHAFHRRHRAAHDADARAHTHLWFLTRIRARFCRFALRVTLRGDAHGDAAF